MSPQLKPSDFVPGNRAAAAVGPSTDPLAALSPTVRRIRLDRYSVAVLAFDEGTPERRAIRKRWPEIRDAAAENPLRGADAFLRAVDAGRRLASLADPQYRHEAIPRHTTVAGALPVEVPRVASADAGAPVLLPGAGS